MKKLLVVILPIVCCGIGWIVVLANMAPSAKAKAVADAYQQYAIEQKELNGYGSAISYSKLAIEQQDSIENRLFLADCYLEAQQPASYVATLEEVMELYPSDSRAYALLAQYYYDAFSYTACSETLVAAQKNGCLTEEMLELYYNAAYQFEVVSRAYEEAHVFLGGYAVVKNEKGYRYIDSSFKYYLDAYTSADSVYDGAVGVMDEEGRKFLSLKSGLRYAENLNSYEKVWSFSGGRALAKRDGQYYYISDKGTEVLGPYSYATTFCEGVAAVISDDYWMLINTAGEQIGTENFYSVKVSEDNYCSKGGVIFASKGANTGYDMYGVDGKLIKACGFSDAKPFYTSNYAAVCVDGFWGLVDKTGTIKLTPQYEDMQSAGKSCVAFCSGGKWGFVTTSGRVVIEPQFEDAKAFSNAGMAPVKIDGSWVYIKLSFIQ